MKVAIVGLGHAGTRFRTAFRNVAREAGTAHRLSFAYVGRHRTTDEIPYYPTVTAMLAGFRPDIVVVSVPEHARAEIFTELAGYTGFVVSEKNLATSRDDLDLVAKNLADVSGFNLDLVERYSEATSYLRAYVRAHQLELVRANFIWGKDRINDHRPTSGVPSEVVHSLDLVPWICGGGHRLEVDTAIGTRSDFSVSGPEVLDSVALTARLGPGAVTGYSSFVHITRKREVDFVFRTPGAELLYASIVFDTPVWDADHLRIWQRRDDGDELIHELRTDGEAGDPELRTVIKLGRLVRDVTRFVEDGTRPEVPFASLEDSLSLQRLLNDGEGRAHRRPGGVLPGRPGGPGGGGLGAAGLSRQPFNSPTTWSMQAVSASTSAGSTAGNIAIRSWLRPSLRYGSVSTIPFARSTRATWAASTPSAKSIVPMTCERIAGSATNGVAYGDFSAHPYSRAAESAVRAPSPGRPAR